MNPILHDVLLLLGCALATVIVECLYWACFRRYRTVEFLSWGAVVNFTSNIMLNTTLLTLQPDGLLSPSVLIGETLVVIYEYLLFLMLERRNRGRLFLLTLLPNVITYSIGFLLS